jgi:hypothetical protein
VSQEPRHRRRFDADDPEPQSLEQVEHHPKRRSSLRRLQDPTELGGVHAGPLRCLRQREPQPLDPPLHRREEFLHLHIYKLVAVSLLYRLIVALAGWLPRRVLIFTEYADTKRYERRLRRWCAADFVVLDDVGLGQVPPQPDAPTAAHMLFNLIERRHQCGSTAITSNIKLSAWGKYLGDATVTAAALDRLAMTAIRLDIDGPSYRQHLAHLRAETSASDFGPDLE